MASLLSDRDAYIDGFSRFVNDSPTSYHTVQAIAEALGTAGFSEFEEASSWGPLGAGSSGYVRRDGALIAWRMGDSVRPSSPIRVLGCHTDSPGLMLKPNPDFSSAGWAQLGVEVYGGPLLTTWFDRDLALAGRLVTSAGAERLVRTDSIARVPMLAIHLDREGGASLILDKQRHLQPVIGVERTSVLELLATAAGIDSEDIAGADVRLVDTQEPGRLGADKDLLASPRLDNLSSVFAGMTALIEGHTGAETISLLAAFDHEELGSESRSGANGPMLEDVLGRLRSSLGATVEDAARAMAASWCISADAGHAVHPNYAEKHDPHVRPIPGGGPILKVNANQRYASDAHGSALWQRCCDSAGVVSQVFVSNNSIPCGTTIGPLTATRLGIRTVDVGAPLLSMHSIRELVHVDDLHGLAKATAAFFAGV